MSSYWQGKGAGKKIAIRFTKALLGDVTGNESAFTVSGFQRNPLRIGALLPKEYTVDSVERYPLQTFFEDDFDGVFDDTELGANGVMLESEEVPTQPDEIGGLALWLKADAGITKDESGLVSEWADQSGNGYDAAASGGDRPTWVGDEWNEKPVLRFGPENIMTIANQTGLTAYTRFFVLGAAHPSVNKTLIVDYSFCFGWRDNGNEFSFAMAPSSGILPFSRAFWKEDAPNIAAVSRSGNAQALFYIDQDPVSTVGSTNRYWNEIAGHLIGYATHPFDVAEIITFNSVLSNDNRKKVETYLAEKYGIEVGDPVYGGAEYFSSGTYTCTVPTANLPTNPRLRFEVNEPEGTSITAECSADGQTWTAVDDGDLLDISGQTLHLRFTLETEDEGVSPTLLAVWLEEAAAPPDTILLTMAPDSRFNDVEGDLTISYEREKGTLTGNRPVEDFTESFTPTGLEPTPLNVQGTITAGIEVEVDLIKVDYRYFKDDSADHIITAGITVEVDLIPVSEIPP